MSPGVSYSERNGNGNGVFGPNGVRGAAVGNMPVEGWLGINAPVGVELVLQANVCAYAPLHWWGEVPLVGDRHRSACHIAFERLAIEWHVECDTCR